MAKTMKAAVVRKFKEPLSIEEVPVPEVGRDQILVKIEACGVCHTDLHAADGDGPVKPNPPFIPGHEGVGTVSAVGGSVTAVKEGDLVGIPWLHTACGHCRHCLAAWETLCDSQQNTGYSVNDGFAEYALADPSYVGHLPAGLDFEPAAPAGCEYIRLADAEIDRRLQQGPELVSANFVILYPPGFPIMVPGQVLTKETIDFMRKLDVKEIHGYDAAEELKLIRSEALAALSNAEKKSKRSRPATQTNATKKTAAE
jgi:hypothetical protein